MTLTDDVYLPSPEEIKHNEIPLTHNYMITSAMWLGKYCDHQCKEFMLCRTEEADPRRCLEYGRQVTECGLEFFKKLKRTCREEYEWYTKCIDWTGSEPTFNRCRHEQGIFDGCMADHGFERAKFGDFTMLRVHESDRPKPKQHVPYFPDAVEAFNVHAPEHKELKTAGLGGRTWWQTWLRG